MSATTDGVQLPTLRRNHKFGLDYEDTEGAFTSVEVDFYLDKLVTSGASARVSLTEASAGVVRTATTVAIDQEPAWVAANLAVGEWEWHLLIDKYEVCWGTLTVVGPPAGDFNP